MTTPNYLITQKIPSMINPHHLVRLRELAIAAYKEQPSRFKLTGMSKDLTEDQKVLLAGLDAAVGLLVSLDPEIINTSKYDSLRGANVSTSSFDD